jgi:acyl-CoA synthetase (AMP-forming)/AMP-acid ligase II
MSITELKLKKIVDPNLLLIINDGFTINNKNYYKGQCVKAINNELVHNYSHEEVDDVLINTIITKIAMDKRVLTKENVTLTRNRNGEIRNKHVIVLTLPVKDNVSSFHILAVNCFISEVCNVSWCDITSQSQLNNILENNIKDDTVLFVYCESGSTVLIENAILHRNEYISNLSVNKVLTFYLSMYICFYLYCYYCLSLFFHY